MRSFFSTWNSSLRWTLAASQGGGAGDEAAAWHDVARTRHLDEWLCEETCKPIRADRPTTAARNPAHSGAAPKASRTRSSSWATDSEQARTRSRRSQCKDIRSCETPIDKDFVKFCKKNLWCQQKRVRQTQCDQARSTLMSPKLAVLVYEGHEILRAKIIWPDRWLLRYFFQKKIYEYLALKIFIE